jgi:MFS family permease
MSADVEGRWAEIFGPKYLAATIILCLGVALLAFNAFLSSTALPTAVKELDGAEVISWSTTLYLVFAIVGGAGAVLVKQRLGARWALLAMAGVFLLGTLVAAGAGTMTQVLVGRAIQGLGEGVVAALCFSLIPELFPNRLVPKIFGMQAVIWAIAAFGGPAGAGALTEFVSWRAAFLVNVPVVAIFCLMVALVVPNKRGDDVQAGFPGIRLLAIGGGILLLAIASLLPGSEALALVAAAALALFAAIWMDRRSKSPLTPTGAFWSDSPLGPGFWVVLLMPVAGAFTAVYLVMLLQQLWGYGPTAAGAVGAVMSVAWSLSSVTVANVRKRSTRHLLIQLGPACLCIGLLGVLSGFLLNLPPLLILSQLVIGAGFGMSSGYVLLTLIEATGDAERDRTSALIPTTQSAGNAIGAAIAGLAANSAGYAVATSTDEILATTVPIFVTAAVIAALAGVTSVAMVRRATSEGVGGAELIQAT